MNSRITVQDISSPPDIVPEQQFARFLDVFQSDPNSELTLELARLEELVTSTDPSTLLAAMSVYHMFHGFGINPENVYSDPLLQFHLEWLQGYCLRFPLNSYSTPALLPAVLGPVTEILKRITVISVIERWHRAMRERGGSIDQANWLQELARIERLAVRNWAYSEQMMGTISELCARMEDWSNTEFGYSLAIVPTLFSRIVAEVESRFNAARREARAVFGQSNSLSGFGIRWQRSSLPGADQAADVIARIERREIDGIAMAREYIAHLETGFPQFFRFESDDLVRLSDGGLTHSQATALLADLSIGFGELANEPIDHFTLGNPTWVRPFVRLDDDTFSCPVAGMLLSHALDIIETLVVDRNANVWWDARSAYLEGKAATLFQSAFPDSIFYEKSKWRDPNDYATVFENDLALVVGDTVLIGEAKAHRVPAKTRRGSPEGLRSTIENLIVEASEQSDRFARYLCNPPGTKNFFHDGSGEFTIDSTNLASSVRANLILDSFAVASASTASLRRDGLLEPEEPNPAPTYLLTDLQSIFLILPDEMQRLHYLTRRQAIQDNLVFEADEMDLLAYYVETGFNSPEFEPDGKEIFMRRIAKPIDTYLEAHFAGRATGERPSRAIHPWYGRFLTKLRDVCPTHWASASIALLDATYADQTAMLADLKQSSKAARRDSAGSLRVWQRDIGISTWKSTIVGVIGIGIGGVDSDSLVREAVELLEPKLASHAVVLLFDPTRSKSEPFKVDIVESG